MPRNSVMSWEGEPHCRWVKMFKGSRYKVTCNELGTPRTKEASYQAANEWWQKTLATIAPTAKLPRAIVNQEGIRDWYLQNGDNELAIKQQSLVDDLASRVSAGEQLNKIDDPLQILSAEARAVWQDRLSQTKKIPTDKNITRNLEKFLQSKKDFGISPTSYKELDESLHNLLSAGFMPASVDLITAETVDGCYEYLASHEWAASTKNKRMGFFRAFVEWLYASELLENRPRNLDTKRFKVHLQAIRKFENVKNILEELPENFRLWGLMGLNCGMTAADLGGLSWDMIDLTKWTLTRKRVKTKDQKNVPTVCYKLWPETIAELKKIPHRTGIVFQTREGKPLYSTSYNAAGKALKKDLFSTYWQRSDPKPSIPLGKFRSIGSTQLKKPGSSYRWAVEIFLGHAPSTMESKRYSAEDDEPFFEATDFIRQQIFGK